MGQASLGCNLIPTKGKWVSLLLFLAVVGVIVRRGEGMRAGLLHNLMREPSRRSLAARLSTEALAMAKIDVPPSKAPIRLRDASYQVRVGSILVRNPIILRPLNSFEAAYEEYRLGLQEEYARGTFDIMTAHRRELVAAGLGEAQSSDAAKRAEGSTANVRLVPEYQKAEGDVRDIRRRLERKLYFVIKDAEGRWSFPSAIVPDAQIPLHQFAPRILKEMLGETAELYHLGNAPLAFYQERIPDRINPPLGVKTFFYRSQVIAGQLVFRRSALADDYAWLTKEELEGRLAPACLSAVSPVLSY